MKHISTNKSQKNSIWISLLWGVVVALLISLIGSLLGTFLINAGSIQENAYPVIAIALWFVSSMIGSLVACKKASQQYLIVSALTVVGYLFVLIAVQILFFESQFGQMWKAILIGVAGIIPSILICSKTEGRKKAKIKYRPI